MAYVLALRPHSPLKRSFSDNPYLNSCSPLRDKLSPLNNLSARNVSACSLYSFGSNRTGDYLRANENTPPLTSQSLLDLVPENRGYNSGSRHVGNEQRTKQHHMVNHLSPTRSRVAAPSNPSSRKTNPIQSVSEPTSHSEDLAEPIDGHDSHLNQPDLFGFYNATRIPLPEGDSSDASGNALCEEEEEAIATVKITSQPFRRWMSTLRRRHVHRRHDRVTESPPRPSRYLEDDMYMKPPSFAPSKAEHGTSESGSSSMACVSAIKTASITIAGTSIGPRSDTGFHARIQLGNRSSHYSEARRSVESHRGALGPVIDESAWLRSLQRRKVVEELISSEEGYVADLKVLINVRNFFDSVSPADPVDFLGLLRNPYSTSHSTKPDRIIHTAKHNPHSTTSRRLVG